MSLSYFYSYTIYDISIIMYEGKSQTANTNISCYRIQSDIWQGVGHDREHPDT